MSAEVIHIHAGSKLLTARMATLMLIKIFVIHKADTAECLCKQGLLLIVWIYAISVCFISHDPLLPVSGCTV